jgi:hypothetical protein
LQYQVEQAHPALSIYKEALRDRLREALATCEKNKVLIPDPLKNGGKYKPIKMKSLIQSIKQAFRSQGVRAYISQLPQYIQQSICDFFDDMMPMPKGFCCCCHCC